MKTLLTEKDAIVPRYQLNSVPKKNIAQPVFKTIELNKFHGQIW